MASPVPNPVSTPAAAPGGGPSLDPAATQDTLDALRQLRRQLFAMPDSDLNAMSLDDQVKYGDSLHQVALAILKLEAAKLQGINEAFAARQQDLTQASSKLADAAAALDDTVKIIRTVSQGIGVITSIVQLLG